MKLHMATTSWCCGVGAGGRVLQGKQLLWAVRTDDTKGWAMERMVLKLVSGAMGELSAWMGLVVR